MKNLVCEHRATREFLCPLALDTLEFRLFTETCVKDVILHYFKNRLAKPAAAFIIDIVCPGVRGHGFVSV